MPERGFATETWDSDEWFQELSRDQRYLFIYLWTNNHCNPAGLYHITLTTIGFETKFPKEELPELLNSLSPKVIWYPAQSLVWVKNFIKRQSKSSKFLAAAAKSLVSIHNNGAVKDLIDYNLQRYSLSIPYQYYMDKVSIPSASDTGTDTDTNSNTDSLFSASLFSLDEINLALSQLPPAVDRLARHEAIKQRLAEIGQHKGFVVKSEYYTDKGRIDLCWLDKQSVVVAAFESDFRTPRDKSLAKLRHLGCPNAYVILRPDKRSAKVEIQQIPMLGEEGGILDVICRLKGWQADEDDVHWLQGLRSEFPGFTLAELNACIDYYSGRPAPKHKGIWKNRFRNWMIKKQEFAKERKGEQAKGQRVKGSRPSSDYRGKW